MPPHSLVLTTRFEIAKLIDAIHRDESRLIGAPWCQCTMLSDAHRTACMHEMFSRLCSAAGSQWQS